MGCNNSKNVTAPETHLGSDGSSVEFEEKGSDEEVFIHRRTWGSPAPPLPSIPGGKTRHDNPPAEQSPSEGMEMLRKHKGGSAFMIQDENTPARINPPRRLQALKDAKPLTMEDLTRKQRQHERKREQKLREKTENLSRQHSRIRGKLQATREFESAQKVFAESEMRLNRVSKNRDSFVNERIMKVRQHNKKVVERKKLFQSLSQSMKNENLDLSGKMEHDMEYNKSESESWADNDSIKNLYDQMEFITPASGLASAVTRNNNINNPSDDEFFS